MHPVLKYCLQIAALKKESKQRRSGFVDSELVVEIWWTRHFP